MWSNEQRAQRKSPKRKVTFTNCEVGTEWHWVPPCLGSVSAHSTSAPFFVPFLLAIVSFWGTTPEMTFSRQRGGVEFSEHAKLRLRESRLKTHEIHFTRDQQPAMQMPQLEGIVVFAASETERQDLHQNAAFCHLRQRVGRALHDKCFSSSTGSHTWHGRA